MMKISVLKIWSIFFESYRRPGSSSSTGDSEVASGSLTLSLINNL